MYLSQALQRENNNLDVFRWLAAVLVIYGHTNALFPQGQGIKEVIWPWLQFDYSGSLAVKIFFFLSGLVVTNSLLHKQSLLQFVVARVFRIWPALLAVLVVMAYVVGPAVTSLPLADYWRDPMTWGYVIDSAMMEIRFQLPGVFMELTDRTVNGSLWSIVHEVRAYVLLAALFALGVHRLRWLAIACFVWVALDPLLPTRTLFAWVAPNKGLDALLPCFAAGALLVLFKDKIQISVLPVLGFGLLYAMFQQAVFAHYLFYGALFFGLLYLATRKWLVVRQLPADISYGVYLWGWPVQQLWLYVWPEINAYWHLGLSVLGACLCGAISWYWLEKPSIAAGRHCYRWLSARWELPVYKV